MRHLSLALALTMACALPGSAEGPRTLNAEVDATRAHAVVLEAGVGEVEVVAGPNDRVTARVELTPRRGGLFSSLKRSERDVAEARLEAFLEDGTVHLEIDSPSKDRRFEEHWVVQVPAHLALDLELGVGEVSVSDLSGGVAAEVGVGDLRVEAGGGELRLEVGVGDVDVVAPADAYGPVRCEAGVGSVTLRARGDRREDEGLLGNEVHWKGPGAFTLTAEAGVGDVDVDLR